ncbi:MAG: hypothetical protein H0T59_07895 [Chloroflexi bacterium]|nr:hypothetical protein [Chloroflexota bacterium]
MDREPASDDNGTAAARARAQLLRDRLERIDLQVVVVGPPDAVRRAARERAQAAADAAGRGALLDDTLGEVREATLRAFSRAAFSGTWAASEMAASVASARDRVAAVAAFEEAAIAAVTEDLVDDDTLDILRATADHLVDLTGMPAPMALSALGSPRTPAVRSPLQGAVIIGAAVALGGFVGSASGAIAGMALGIVIVAVMARVLRQPEA